MVQVDGQDGARAEPLRYKIVHANPDANYEARWAAGAALVRELSTEPLARRFVRELSFVRGCTTTCRWRGAGCVRELSLARELWIFFGIYWKLSQTIRN